MRTFGSFALSSLWMSTLFTIGCRGQNSGRDAPKPDDKVVNLYTWADYIAPDVLAPFEKTTGVRDRVALIETNGTLETRMLTGHSGYDLVVPTAQDFPRQIRSGAYLPL